MFPTIKPAKSKDCTSLQCEYAHCAKLPMRSIVLGPSGSGKTILLQYMILDIYKGCFDRIYIFSPSVDLDHTWLLVKEYIKDKHKINTEDKDDPIYFEEHDSEALTKIIGTQSKVTDHMKKHKD